MTYPIDVYQLLPAVYRREDAGLSHPLEALLGIISTEAGHLQQDIAGLWDDFFVETAEDWVIPYLADLVGSTPLHPVTGSWRTDVAGTISYRRRKGALEMLEELAGDVTGWGARVVPFFEDLGWTQHLDHLRRANPPTGGRVGRVGTVDLGALDALDRLGGPFDDIVKSVDIRPFGEGRGRHNIKKIGFFLWRLRSYPLVGVTARAVQGHEQAYHLSPLGNTAPLFTAHVHGSSRPSERDLPGPIRRLALHSDLEAAIGAESHYYGTAGDRSVVIAVGPVEGAIVDQALPASRVSVCDLSTWRLPPAGKDAAIDPYLGRLTLATAPASEEIVRVSYCYGFGGAPGAELGGGPYDREPPVSPARLADETSFVREVTSAGDGSGESPSVKGAIADWQLADPRPGRAVIRIVDSATYSEGDLDIVLPLDATLEIRSADTQRPVLDVTRLTVRGSGGGTLVLDGIVVMGEALRIGPGVSQVVIRHATLVPGRSFDSEGLAEHAEAASVLATSDADGCRVALANAIVGPVLLPAEGWSLRAADSIIDSPADETAVGGPDGDHGPTCDLRHVTVLGDVRVRSVAYASDVLFAGSVEAERTQTGCVRFSYVGEAPTAPHRYRCQPDLALADAAPATRATILSRLRPRFTSRDYGRPGYGQLAVDAAAELTSGGEGETEMGAFNQVLEARRIANLQIRLEEYLPAGLEPGLIFAT
jgi:hypothetical protein